MRTWFKYLDRLLRGEATQLPLLKEGTLEAPAGGMTAVVVILGVVYGACMGCYALLKVEGPSGMQLLATMIKVPALFLLTLLVTFPSLYVFNALVGSRLFAGAVMRLLVASLAVTLAVLASLGPIVAFFSVCTTSYPFMVLLNVVVYAVAGVLGLKFLVLTLHRLSIAQGMLAPEEPSGPIEVPVANPAGPDPSDSTPPPAIVLHSGPLGRGDRRLLGRRVKVVFRCWMVVFGLVGAQMAWVLRPFIGNPDQPFTWFRARESNFFMAVWGAILKLFG